MFERSKLGEAARILSIVQVENGIMCFEKSNIFVCKDSASIVFSVTNLANEVKST